VTATTTTPNATTAEDRLRTVLRVDALVTGAVGLFGLLGPTSTYGDTPAWLPRTLGAGFLLFAIVLAIAIRGDASPRLAGTITAEAALLSAVAAAVVLALVDLPTRGEVVVALVGLVTLAFGITELRIVRTMRSAI
jgi:hypothetical protein